MMEPGKRFTGFLLLQNMVLQDFVRQGLVNHSIDAGQASRLARLETLNTLEIARWGRDLLPSDDNGGDVGLEDRG